MARAASSSKVSKALQDALADEVAEVSRKYKASETMPAGKNAGDYVYDTVDRMRVYDRALKLESVKLKTDDDGYGSKFGN